MHTEAPVRPAAVAARSRSMGITVGAAALVLATACGSPATGPARASAGTASATSSLPPTRSPTAAEAFVALTTGDRFKISDAFQTVVADCPFPTEAGTVIAPVSLDGCDPALDQLVTVTRAYQADMAATLVPAQYTSQGQSITHGLAAMLPAIAAYRLVDHSRDLATIIAPTGKLGSAELEVTRAFFH